jgi:hypothetical protein
VLVEITQEKWKLLAASMYFDIENQIENNFTKMDEITRYAKGGKLLIAADTNSRSKTWHDNKANSRGRKLEEFLLNRNLHLINKESETTTFLNNRGSSNIDLTIANHNLVADVNEWRISNEESLSDRNYLQYKIRKGGTYNQNNPYSKQGTRFIIKEEKLQEFDRNLIQEIRKMANKADTEGGTEELDKDLSTRMTTENEVDHLVDTFSQAVQTSGNKEALHPIQAYTDGSKSDIGVGAGVVIFHNNELIKTMQYRLKEQCINNQAEQMAILKALNTDKTWNWVKKQ